MNSRRPGRLGVVPHELKGGLMKGLKNRWLRRSPSPAMVVACIALIVALGGTGYAAIILPANSVGTKQLKRNAVVSKKVKNNSITGADVRESTLRVGTAGIKDNAVTSAKIADASVGARILKSVTFVQGTGVPVTNGTSAEATVTCPAGRRLLNGGGEWQSDLAGTSLIYSVPSPVDPNITWVVKGRVAAGATDNVIFAEAACIAG
jgi:hypothetical protein